MLDEWQLTYREKRTTVVAETMTMSAISMTLLTVMWPFLWLSVMAYPCPVDLRNDQRSLNRG